MKLKIIFLTLICFPGAFQVNAQEISAGGGVASQSFINTDYESRNYLNNMPAMVQFSAGIYDWNKRKKYQALTLSYQQYYCNLYSGYSRHGSGTEYKFKQKRSSLSIAHLPIGIGFFNQKCTLRLGYGFNVQLSNQSTGRYRNYNYRRPGSYDTGYSFSYYGSEGFGTPLSFALATTLQIPLYNKHKSHLYARAQCWFALTPEIDTRYDLYAPMRGSMELHYGRQIFSDIKRKSFTNMRQIRTDKYAEKRSKRIQERKAKRRDISNQNIEIYTILGLNTAHFRHPEYKPESENQGMIGLGFLVSPHKKRKRSLLGMELTHSNIRIDADYLSYRDSSIFRNISTYYIGINRLGIVVMPLKARLAHNQFFLGLGVKANYNFYSTIYDNFTGVTFRPGSGKDPYFGNGQARNLRHTSISTYTTASVSLTQRQTYNLKLKFTHAWSPITEVRFGQYLFSSMQTGVSLVLGFK